MRCPACGFVSFDSLPACKRCGTEFPRVGMTTAVPLSRPADLRPALDNEGAVASQESIPAPGAERPVDARPAEPERPGGFWLRAVAFLVDAFVVTLFSLGGTMLLGMAVQVGGIFSSTSEAGLEWLNRIASTVLVWLIILCYFTLFVGCCGQTPGKMLLGLRIMRPNGQRIGYGRSFARWIAQCLALLPLGLGFLMIAFSRRKRGLHDKLAGTMVVRTPS